MAFQRFLTAGIPKNILKALPKIPKLVSNVSVPECLKLSKSQHGYLGCSQKEIVLTPFYVTTKLGCPQFITAAKLGLISTSIGEIPAAEHLFGTGKMLGIHDYHLTKHPTWLPHPSTWLSTDSATDILAAINTELKHSTESRITLYACAHSHIKPTMFPQSVNTQMQTDDPLAPLSKQRALSPQLDKTADTDLISSHSASISTSSSRSYLSVYHL